MQDWFLDARLGIFIHWGIYSAGDWSESWAFFNNEVDYDTYMAQAATFTADRYDPEAWADAFAAAGARYAVLTTKHHDGFALWPTRQSRLNAVEGSPAGRDLVGPFCDALRRRGLKVGLYFSHLDWSHPDYASILPQGAQPHSHGSMHANRFGYPQEGEDPAAWDRFLAFHRAQLTELCEAYQPDLLWFDGDWERDPEQWRFQELRDMLHSLNPNVVLNSRMGGYGDYNTPEQAIPITPPNGPWEFCVTMNDSWGYQKRDHNHKSVRQCIRMLAECAGMGGNLLLDVGPHSDGSFQPEQAETLQGLARWTATNEHAIFNTERGLPHGHFYGVTTLSKDHTRLYAITFDRPNGSLCVKGIRNTIASVRTMDGTELAHRKIGGAQWAGLPGELWIDIPDEALDPDATAIEIALEGSLDLYSGSGDHATTA